VSVTVEKARFAEICRRASGCCGGGDSFLGRIWIEILDGRLVARGMDGAVEYCGDLGAVGPGAAIASGVEAKRLAQLAAKLPAGEWTLAADKDGDLVISKGSKRYRLPTAGAQWRPDFSKEPPAFSPVEKGLFPLLFGSVAPFAGQEDSETPFTGHVHFFARDGKAWAEAVDGRQFARISCDAAEAVAALGLSGKDLILPVRRLEPFKKYLHAVDGLARTEKRLVLRTPDETFSAPVVVFGFTNCDGFMARVDSPAGTVDVRREDLDGALGRLKAVMDLTQNRAVRVEAVDGGLEISTPERDGWERLEVTVNGLVQKVFLPVDDILDVLGLFDGEIIELGLGGPLDPVRIMDQGRPEYRTVVMPMKVNDYGPDDADEDDL